MLSEMMNKRVFGRMASLVMVLTLLSLAFGASRLIAAPYGVLEEPKPTESKDKDKEKDDAPKDEDADEDKESSDDKKDADSKDDASKDEKKDEKKEDLDKERERVAEESEAEKQKALDNLSKTPGGQDMSAAEKAEMEAQLEALKQAAIKSVGKTPPPAPKKTTIKPQATKPAINMDSAKKPGTTFEDTEAGKRIRRKIGPRGGLPKVTDAAANDETPASKKNTKGNRRNLIDTSKENPEVDPNSNAEDVGEPKTAEQKRQEAIEKAQQRAKDRRADLESKRRDKMNAILDRGKNDRDDKKPSSTKRPRVGKRGRSKVDVDVEDAADDDDSSVQSPIGEIPAVFIDIKMAPAADREFSINYEETPWMDVVADFARMSRLPFVRNLDDEIEGTLTYFSTEKFSYDGAFHKLNELLFDRPLNNLVIQRLNDRITVVRIPDLLKAVPKDRIFGSFAEFRAANLDPYVACQTQYVPPVGFTPFQIIERYRPLFSDTYGVKISDPDRLELTGFAKEHIYFDEMVRHLTNIENPDEIDKYVTIQLNYAKANDVLTILRQLYPIQGAAAPPAKRGGRRGRRQPQANAIAPDLEDADAVNIITEAKANILYIKAPDYLMKELRSRIAELDVPTESRPEMELVELTYADASTVVSQVLPILQSIGPRITKSPDFVAPKEQAKFDVTLFPSANGNGIVIVGGREGIEFVRQLVLNQFDVPPDWITKSIGLQHRDASYIVERLNEAMPSSGGGPTAVRRGKKGGPAIVATVDQPPSITIVSSRSLFVSASRFDLAMIEDLVQKLDVVDPEEPSEHFVYVRCATPSEIAETVQQIMAEDSTPKVAQPIAAKNAKARAAARQRAARASRGRSVQSGGDGPMIIPNDADQSLLVYCSDPDWIEVQRLIDRLESNACDVEPQWVQIKLERAEPTDIATYINQMFPAPGGSAQSVTADSFNKTINIYATPMFIEKVRPLIEKIDYTSTGELTIIKLMWAKAEIIAPIIQQAVPESQYVSPTARINAATAKTRRGKTPPKAAQNRVVQSAGDTKVRIVAEPVTNSLLVTAPPEKLRTIENLVSQMEAVAESQRPEKVIVNVINRKADEIAGVLSSILNATQGAGGKEGAAGGSVNPTDVELSITAIGDQLILFGPQNEVAEAIQLVTQIDTLDAMPITRKVRVYDAEEDEKKLRSMLALKADTAISVNQAPQKGGRRAPNRRAPTKPTAKLTDTGATVSDVQIYANPYENTLLIRAMPKDWKLIEEILDVIRDDAPPIPGSEDYESMFIVNLKHKSAWDISYDLEDVINIEGRRPVTFKEGPRDKDLIVMNFRPSQRPEIEKWIEIYDVPKDGGKYGSGYVSIDVKGGMSALDAARLLKARAGSEFPIEIAEIGSGSAVQTIDIHAGEEEEEAASTEGKRTDRGADGRPISALPSHMLPLWLRDVVCAAAIGQSESETEKDDGAPLGGHLESILNPPTDRVQILTDPDTGKLILLGPEEEVQRLRDILEELMGDEKTEPVMRIFPLKYAPVSEVAAKLNEIFNSPAQRTVNRGRGNRAQPQLPGQPTQAGKGDDKNAKGKQPVQQQAPATPARIKVIPNERTSSVVVVAPPKEIPLIVEVLRHLDSKRILDVNMRMFEMKNLDASQVVENLKEVLGIEDRALTRAPQRGRGAANQRAQQQVQIQGDDGDTLVSADKVKLTAESQTNTIIAQGPPDTLDLIEGIIKDLEDKTIKSDVEMMRIVLRKARASEIADIVQSLIDETINNQNATPAAAPQRGRGRGRTPAAASRRNENVSVHADPRTNSVILAGPGDQLEKAKAIVEELDNTEVGLVIRQIPVKGEATEIANTLRTLYNVGGRPGASPDVIITPLDATHTILIKAPEPLMVDIEEQLALIDAKFESSDKLRKIEMKFANAETVATQLSELFGTGRTSRGSTNRSAQISIRGYKSSGIIYVQAPDEEFERIKATAEDLDKVDTSVQVHRLQLNHAPAQQVLTKIQAMMGEAIRSGAMGNTNLDYVSMQADPRTNSLILVGGPTSALLLGQMLATIDVPQEGKNEQETKVYTLPPTINVADIVRNINELFRGISLTTHGVEPPVVTPNQGSNLIIVRANGKQHEQIERDVVNPVKAEGDKGVRKDNIYVVNNAKAVDLANVLTRHVRETMQQVNRQYPVNIVADEGTNQLIVNATDEDFNKIRPMIEALDQESGERRTEVFKVQYVSPWSMATIITQQFRGSSRNPNDQVNASFEDGTYSIIVTANDENMAKVRDLILKADVPSKETITEYVQLKHGQSDEMRTSIDAALRGRYPSDRRGQMPFNVTSQNLSNTLIVSAREDIMPEILDMISRLDIPGGGEHIRRVFKLTFSEPGSVSRMIQNLFRPTSGRPSPREQVKSSDDWATNSVIVSAVESKMLEVEQLINEMDQPGDSVRTERVINIENADPNDVASSIQQILQQATSGQRGRQAAVVRAVRGTTKIVAYANEKEYESIKSLVEQIDIEGGRIIHAVVIPDQVPARTIADNINNLFGRGRQGGDAPHAESHEPTNTVLVSATDAEFERIQAQLITPLSDSKASGIFSIHYIPVKNAIADEVAQTMQAFFDKKAGISSNRGFGRGGRGGGQSAEDRDNQVTITAEPNSNTLIVYCTEKTKKEIDDLLAVIDSADTTEKRVEMVALQYVDATTMIEILTEVLRVSRTSAKEPDDRPWWARDNDRDDDKDVVLAGDTRLKAITETNSVIVAGKSEAVEDALAKIAELDKPGDTGDTPVPIRLVNTNASTLAETLKQVFVENNRSGSGGRNGKSSGPELTIVPDQSSNTIYVRGKLSDVNKVVEQARQMDSEASGGESGIVVIPIPFGHDVTDLANMIESQINENEQNEKQKNRNYTPDLVKITPNARTNVLLVNASKSKLEDVKRVIEDMQQQMQFRGGPTRRVLKIENMTPEQAKELIEKVKEGQQSSGSSGNTRRSNRGGRRGDANWTHNRRFDDAKHSASPRRTKRAGTMVAASMPVFLMNVAISTGFAQSDAPKKDDREPPRSMRIRPQQRDDKKSDTNNEPRARKTVASGQPAARGTQPQPAGRDPRDPNAATSNAERLIRERAAASSGPRMSDEVLEQLSRRLSGTDINVIEAPDGSLILEGLEQDVDIVAGIIEMVDQQTPLKQIEIVMLKNQLAEPLAQKLTTVFKTLEPPNPRPIDKVDFLADQRTNSIFIAAAPSNMQRAIDLARMADQPSNISRQTKSFVFQNRRVMEVGETIKKIAANYLRQLQLPTDQIQIEIDSFTNQVIVSAGEQDLEFVETIVKTLDMSIDDAEAADKMSEIGKADVMVVPLRISQAPTLAILINELLTKAATGDTPLKDFIRRFRLLDENGNPIADVNLDRPIAVFGEPESNSLIIASTKENCLVVKQIAMAFDKEPSKAAVTSRVFTLAYADATEVATQLDALLTSTEQITSKASGGGGAAGVPDGPIGALVYKAVVSADARTNQVVVIGRPEAVEAMAGLVEKLDVKGQGVMPFEIVKLNHANASGLATALTDLMDKRKLAMPAGGENSVKSETVVIVPDERSVSLIIAAKRERIEELKGLIAKLDIPATALIDNIRTLTLKNSTATDLAAKLQDLWSQSEANRDSAQGGLTFETPAIVADERSNSLIIAASESDFDAIKSVVEKIENLELNPMSDIYIVRLKHNSAAELKGPLQTMFDKRAEMRSLQEPRPEDKVSIESDPVNNALIFVASRENHELLMQKIADLDQPIGAIPVVEFFKCENVYADTVKEAIENFVENAFRPGTGGDSSVLTERNKVAVVVDSRANMLIVSASPENMEVIRRIYSEMNDIRSPWTPVHIQIVELKNTEASQLASKVETWLEQLNTDVQSGTSGGGGSQNQFAVRVIADTVRNWLFVGGTRDGVRQAMDFIAKYDQPIDPNVGPFVSAEVYPLNQAKASQVGEMLRNIFDARNNQSGTGDAAMQPIPVTVEINEPGNSLLINASRQDHLMVTGLLARLDVPSEIPRMFKVYPLSKASATVVKETLDQIYQSSSTQGGGAQGIVTVAEERTNSVVVAVPPGELANVQKLITQLDQIEITEIAEVEVIQCENEDANKMAELLTEIMTGQSAQGGAGSAADAESARQLSSLLVQFEAKDQYGQRDILQTVRENVQISYNERSNSVIVVAPPSSMRLIKKLVQKLDGIQKREVRVKVFPLVNSDAAIMVEKLESMFAQDDSASDQEAFQQGREITVEGGASDVASGPEFAGAANSRKGTFGRPRTTFVADERTNSIIVAGWPEDIDVAADIIDALDSRDIQERITTVYPLVNMKADEVQGSLDSYFQAQRDAQSSVEGQAQARLLEKDVTVVSHEESNQLIVSSSPRYQSEVLRIIQQLDAPPPQVMIEVMIAEVTLDDSFEMGMEFALQQLKFSETAVAGGNGILQSNSFDFVGGTDLGAAGAGLGGFSFTITGEDFNFLVRALQSDSRLDVIQRPMIMCQNNQTASINIGQQVPFVRGTTVSDNGQTTANIEYEPVGVILNVEPIINPDGFVYMLIEPEVSSITDSSIPLGNGIFAPIISEQKASTTVAVKDGETVVIGGLITTRETESESKVPVLGDMPGIGNLFRTTSRRNTRSELLIAMTPTIIRSVEDARRTSEFQRDLGGYLTPEVKGSPLMRNLQVEPESYSEIDSIESDPGTMQPRVLPSGKPQIIPTQPQRGPSYVPAAPRYGPVVPQSTSGTANVMVRNGAAVSPGASQASYQRPVSSQRIGTMQPALPTVDQVRSGAAPLGRPNQDLRPGMPQGNPQTYANRPAVASSPVRTYMRLPEFSADEEAARPIVKISTHPSKRSTSEKEALRRQAAVKKSNRSDTHR